MERTHVWVKVADATRPLTAAPVEKRLALEEVVRTVDAARAAGHDSPEMSHVRGLALAAIASGIRAEMIHAIARIYGTALVERARAHGV